MISEPGERLERVAERVRPSAASDFRTILKRHADDFIERRRRGDKGAQHDARVPGIIRNQRFAVEHGIIGVPIVHQFDRGADRIDRSPRFVSGVRRFPRFEIASEPGANLEFET